VVSPSGASTGAPATARPSPSTGASGRATLTAADNGTTVRIKVGQSVKVMLGSNGMLWDLPAATGNAVRRTSANGGYPTSRPASATFRAIRPGAAVLSSMTDAKCLHAQPRCAIAQRLWSVTVIVRSQ
jgi:hypothetical protein